MSPADDAPAPRRPLAIAIDGPAASGKSSTAQWVASRLAVRHVDSGALYRAATAVALRGGRPSTEWTEPYVLDAARAIDVIAGETSFVPRIGEVDVSDELRSADVTRHVSQIAQMPSVREWVNAQVRRLAEEHDVVVDGRDIGTAVLPKAQLKVFLVADPWERARRRLVQQLGRRPTDAEIAAETDRLVRRDAADATQTVQPKEAVLIDTTYLTQPEQVERIVALAEAVREALRAGVTPRADDTSPVD